MNCRDIESLILTEKDGALTPEQAAALTGHVAACPHCRQFRADLATSLKAYRDETASITAPDADEAWREIQGRLHEPATHAKKTPLAPVVWFGAPLAAAAALAFTFFTRQPEAAATDPLEASAEFVEAGDASASTMVYVDKDSGWLVVWAAGDETPRNG